MEPVLHHPPPRMRARLLAAGAAALGCALLAPPVLADPSAPESAPELARRARMECEAGRAAGERDVRKAHFDRGLELAERAVALDERNAEAHFVLFCNMGELMRLDGERITSVLGLRKLLAQLDRTLQLDPGHLDAMSSKGTFLIRLPRLLGGDPETGEKMLREVLARDPNAVSARLTLAKYVQDNGRHEEAVAHAERALQIARAQGRADKIASAQATLAELGERR